MLYLVKLAIKFLTELYLKTTIKFFCHFFSNFDDVKKQENVKIHPKINFPKSFKK